MEKLQIQPDESASLVGEFYNVSADYVRKLVNGQRTPQGKTAKKKAQAILKTYWAYKNGKVQLLERVKNTVKI